MGRLLYKKQQRLIIILFLVVPLVMLITFSYIPLYKLGEFSLHKWNGISKEKVFLGLDNYIKLFTQPKYFEVFKVSLYYLVGSFVQLALALLFATLLNYHIVGKNFFKGTLFVPYLLNGVAIGFIFLFFFKPDGTLDSILSGLGMDGLIKFWLRDPKINNISLAAVSVWRYMGFNFIVLLGAMQSISKSVYEAAAIDGANRWQIFKRIQLPSILLIVEINLILSIKGAISVFEIPYIMTGGSNQTKTFVIQTVDTAFKHKKVGLASAMAVVLLIIVVIVTLIQRAAFKKDEVEGG